SEKVCEEAAIARLEHEVERRTIRAPVAGQIGEGAAEHQVGSGVPSAARLGISVAPGRAPGRAGLLPAALRRARRRPPARPRHRAFPWAQYGSLAATVTQVGNDTTSDGQIRVELSLAAAQTSAIPLGHGLPALVEIEVGRVSPAVLALRTGGELLATQPKIVSGE